MDIGKFQLLWMHAHASAHRGVIAGVRLGLCGL